MRTLVLAVFVLAATAGQADETHAIDWYMAHTAALKNALIQCNEADGLIANQDCRNAITAARILEAQAQTQVSVESGKNPSL